MGKKCDSLISIKIVDKRTICNPKMSTSKCPNHSRKITFHLLRRVATCDNEVSFLFQNVKYFTCYVWQQSNNGTLLCVNGAPKVELVTWCSVLLIVECGDLAAFKFPRRQLRGGILIKWKRL